LKTPLWPLNTVDILCPEANLSSSHKNQTTSISIWDIAKELKGIGTRAGELKADLKSKFDQVPIVRAYPISPNRVYTQSSGIAAAVFAVTRCYRCYR
jgi:hypothetical protein